MLTASATTRHNTLAIRSILGGTLAVAADITVAWSVRLLASQRHSCVAACTACSEMMLFDGNTCVAQISLDRERKMFGSRRQLQFALQAADATAIPPSAKWLWRSLLSPSSSLSSSGIVNNYLLLATTDKCTLHQSNDTNCQSWSWCVNIITMSRNSNSRHYFVKLPSASKTALTIGNIYYSANGFWEDLHVLYKIISLCGPMRPSLLCGCPNRPHYGSCLSVRFSFRPSVCPVRTLSWKEKGRESSLRAVRSSTHSVNVRLRYDRRNPVTLS